MSASCQHLRLICGTGPAQPDRSNEITGLDRFPDARLRYCATAPCPFSRHQSQQAGFSPRGHSRLLNVTQNYGMPAVLEPTILSALNGCRLFDVVQRAQFNPCRLELRYEYNATPSTSILNLKDFNGILYSPTLPPPPPPQNKLQMRPKQVSFSLYLASHATWEAAQSAGAASVNVADPSSPKSTVHSVTSEIWLQDSPRGSKDPNNGGPCRYLNCCLYLDAYLGIFSNL